MKVLVDHDIEGQADLLFASLAKDEWTELLDLQFVYLREAGLSVASDDTTIWRFAQAQGMLLLTGNRNRKDETSLTATISRENLPISLPVLTIANPRRLEEPDYRREVAESLVEVLFNLENFFGTGRIFLPSQTS